MEIPGPGLLQFIKGVRSRGFLDLVGTLWREHGDVFQVRIGRRTLVFAMHPDAVEHVTVGQRQRYDKRASYDSVRKYLLGEGIVATATRTTRSPPARASASATTSRCSRATSSWPCSRSASPRGSARGSCPAGRCRARSASQTGCRW